MNKIDSVLVKCIDCGEEIIMIGDGLESLADCRVGNVLFIPGSHDRSPGCLLCGSETTFFRILEVK